MEFDYAKIQAELDALSAGMINRAEFTEEQDFAIKHAYSTGRNKDEFARWYKNRYGWGCRETLTKRAKELL